MNLEEMLQNENQRREAAQNAAVLKDAENRKKREAFITQVENHFDNILKPKLQEIIEIFSRTDIMRSGVKT